MGNISNLILQESFLFNENEAKINITRLGDCCVLSAVDDLYKEHVQFIFNQSESNS